jgi:DNA-binding NarL/FixJ family response regulator
MKVLLVDDHPMFGFGFALALTQAGAGIEAQAVLTIDAGLAAIERQGDVDVVLVDYRLAEGDGLEGLRRFGAHHPLVARVLISGDEDSALAERARAAGASGFLGKSMSIDALQAALLAIERGETYFHSRAEPLRGVAPSALPTARQLEVLALVAQGEPNKRIAHELGIAERTVKLHLTAMFETLGARNRTHLLVVAREKGLL